MQQTRAKWWYAKIHRLVDEETTDKALIAFVYFYNRIVPNPLYRKHYKQLARRFNQ